MSNRHKGENEYAVDLLNCQVESNSKLSLFLRGQILSDVFHANFRAVIYALVLAAG